MKPGHFAATLIQGGKTRLRDSGIGIDVERRNPFQLWPVGSIIAGCGERPLRGKKTSSCR
jgi:hypothetical protein